MVNRIGWWGQLSLEDAVELYVKGFLDRADRFR